MADEGDVFYKIYICYRIRFCCRFDLIEGETNDGNFLAHVAPSGRLTQASIDIRLQKIALEMRSITADLTVRIVRKSSLSPFVQRIKDA